MLQDVMVVEGEEGRTEDEEESQIAQEKKI